MFILKTVNYASVDEIPCLVKYAKTFPLATLNLVIGPCILGS